MSTVVESRGNVRALRKIVAIAAILFLAYLGLQFVGEAALRYSIFSEASYGGYWANRGWLLTHLVGGTLALLMGPFQFWSGLRRTHMRIHRWTGRLYLAGVVIGAAVSFVLASRSTIGPSWSAGLMLLASVWLATAAMAFTMIAVYKNVEAHKQWMIRSYVVTFAFAVFRLLDDLPLFTDMPFPERFTTLGYLSWIVPLFLTEIVLQFRNLRPRARIDGR